MPRGLSMRVSYNNDGIRLNRDATDVSSKSIYMLSGNFSLRKVLFLFFLAAKRNMLSYNSLSSFNLRSLSSMSTELLF